MAYVIAGLMRQGQRLQYRSIPLRQTARSEKLSNSFASIPSRGDRGGARDVPAPRQRRSGEKASKGQGKAVCPYFWAAPHHPVPKQDVQDKRDDVRPTRQALF